MEKRSSALPIILIVIGLIVVALLMRGGQSGTPSKTQKKQKTTTDSGSVVIPGATTGILGTPSSFLVGINQPFSTSDGSFQKILANPSSYPSYAALFAKYHIKTIRYPGGTVQRYYFWNDKGQTINGKNLSSAAAQMLVDHSGNKKDVNQEYNVGNYEQFLHFTVAAGLQPIIGLNDVFYQDGSNIYPVTTLRGKGGDLGLQANRWPAIESYIEAQLKFTHSIIPGSVTWEIGNESHSIMDAEHYGEVVVNYSAWIKKLYPNDKIIVSYSKGPFSAKNNKDGSYTAQWNNDLVAYLEKNNALSRVTYFTLHYYYGSDNSFATQSELDAQVKDNYFTQGLMRDMKAPFPSSYTPKFSATEFSPLSTTAQPEYNTQMHALLMLDDLMKLHSDSSIVSVSRHTGINSKNGSFFTNDMISQAPLSSYASGSSDSALFPYIPPETTAMEIFSDATGDTPVVPLQITDTYELLVTQTGTKKFIQILNYETSAQVIDIHTYGNGVYTTYTFPDLTAHLWNATTNKTSGTTANGSITVPAHSFTTIEIGA